MLQRVNHHHSKFRQYHRTSRVYYVNPILKNVKKKMKEKNRI